MRLFEQSAFLGMANLRPIQIYFAGISLVVCGGCESFEVVHRAIILDSNGSVAELKGKANQVHLFLLTRRFCALSTNHRPGNVASVAMCLHWDSPGTMP